MSTRSLKRTIIVGLLAALDLFALPARAEPYLAQREGYKCGRCHVNRTGGGKRTAFGHHYARSYLSIFSSASKTPEAAVKRRSSGPMLDPNLNDYVSVGANVRLSNSTIFADKVQNTFENREANLYAELNLSGLVNGLTLYGDLSLAEGSVEGREAFILLPWRSFFLKAGYFLPPFGLRIWGDEEFIRRETGYNYASPDLGLELGYDGQVLSAFLAVSNGAGGGLDSDNRKMLSLLVEASFAYWRAGLSGSYNRSGSQSRILGGAYLGLSLGRLTLLGEADVLTSLFHDKDATVHSLLAYGELNLLILRGLNLKVSYGFHDPALDVVEDQRFALRSAVEVFPYPSLAASLSYTLRQSVPQDEVGNADTLMAELHLFL